MKTKIVKFTIFLAAMIMSSSAIAQIQVSPSSPTETREETTRDVENAFPWLRHVPSALYREKSILLQFLSGELSIEEIHDPRVWMLLGGGDIIGNGGGLLESYFFASYESIPQYIGECLKSPLCKPEMADRSLLSEIARIAEANKEKSYSLVFLSRARGQMLFSKMDPTRVAMTGFEPGLPIFINLDRVYDSLSRSSLSREDTIAILVHELGHQAGERSHSRLDRLGAIIKNFIASSALTIKLKRPEMPRFEVWIENTGGDISHLVAFISNRVKTRSFKKTLADRIVCPSGFALFNFTLSNPHWIYEEGSLYPSLGLWADIQCTEDKTEEIHDFFLDLELPMESLMKSFRPQREIE